MRRRTTVALLTSLVALLSCGTDSSTSSSTRPDASERSDASTTATMAPSTSAQQRSPASTAVGIDVENSLVDAGTTESGSPRPERLPPSSTIASVTGEVPQSLLQRLVDIAADETGVEQPEIDIVRAEAVVWNDGSLGCPEPGVMYTQVPADGYHVELVAGDALYDYRVADGDQIRRCERTGGRDAIAPIDP